MDGWKLIALFVVQISDIEVWLRSKINYNYSWFLRRGSSRLIKWIYKERHELLLLKRKQQHNYSLSKQTQPRYFLLACLPPCNLAYAFIQLARKRVQRFEKMTGIVNKVYCACSLTSSIEGKWPRLFIMLAAFFGVIVKVYSMTTLFPLYILYYQTGMGVQLELWALSVYCRANNVLSSTPGNRMIYK